MLKYKKILAINLLILMVVAITLPVLAETEQQSILSKVKENKDDTTGGLSKKLDSFNIKVKKAISELYLKVQAYTWPFSIGAIPIGIIALICGFIFNSTFFKKTGAMLIFLVFLKWALLTYLPIVAPDIFTVP